MAIPQNGNQQKPTRVPPPMTDMDQSPLGAKQPGSITPEERALIDRARIQRDDKNDRAMPPRDEQPPVQEAQIAEHLIAAAKNSTNPANPKQTDSVPPPVLASNGALEDGINIMERLNEQKVIREAQIADAATDDKPPASFTKFPGAEEVMSAEVVEPLPPAERPKLVDPDVARESLGEKISVSKQATDTVTFKELVKGGLNSGENPQEKNTEETRHEPVVPAPSEASIETPAVPDGVTEDFEMSPDDDEEIKPAAVDPEDEDGEEAGDGETSAEEGEDAETDDAVNASAASMTEEDILNAVKVVDAKKAEEDPNVKKGITVEEAARNVIEERKEYNKKFEVADDDRTLGDVDLMEAHREDWYRVIEGRRPDLEAIKKRLDPKNAQSVQTVDFKTDPNFEMDRINARRSIMDGGRLVQVVAIQSGYYCFAKPLNARQLGTFGRYESSDRHFAYENAIANSVYEQLTDFSCGKLDFNKWCNVTAYGDLETLIYGIYMATFPNVNYYNINCDNPRCRKVFTVPINHGDIVYIPPGSITYDTIKSIINGDPFDPKETMKNAQRWTGKRIFIKNGLAFFQIMSPSIIQHIEWAYKGKKQEVIERNEEDHFNASWVRGYGILDIDHFKKTGEYKYYLDTNRINIEQAIAELEPDDKILFDTHVAQYQNKNRMQFQLSRVICPHCRNIVSNQPISIRGLFFDARALRYAL
jgi:hypothetical protein